MADQEEKDIKARRFQEQCFLIHNFAAFADSNKEKGYKNFVPLTGDPTDITNKLLAIPNLAGLMSIKPYMLSSLVPQVRIYKVFYPQENSEGTNIEMPFEDALNPADLARITASGAGRGMGVGMKSFEWELLGTNPAEADNNIKAKLKLHFATLEDLSVVRAGEGDQATSFLNLVVPSAKFVDAPPPKPTGGGAAETKKPCATGGDRVYNNKYFRIRAHVGYGVPQGHIWEGGDDIQGLKRSVESARQTLYLSLIGHSIEFNEDGSLSLEIEYVAAMEGALVHPKADVLRIGDANGELEARKEARNEERKEIKKSLSEDPDGNCLDEDEKEDAKEDAEEAREKLQEEATKDRAKLYNAVLSALEASKSIYFIDVTAEDIELMNSGPDAEGPATRTEKKTASWVMSNRQVAEGTTKELQDAADTPDDMGDAREATATRAVENGMYRINYFHFGDLLDIAFRCLYESSTPDLAELKTLVGPYVYTDPATGKSEANYNLADIPISMNLFQIWFMDHVVKPQRDKYPLKGFIKDTVTALVGSAMSPKCFGKEYSKAIARLSTSIKQVPSNDDGTCRITGKSGTGPIGGQRASIENIKPFPTGENKDGKNSFPYLFVYVSSQSPTELGPPAEGTREERDAKKGIYHFRIGSDSGLVKKIKFKKADQPYAREARMTTEGDLSTGYLREKYDADVELFGNAVFKPGTLVYIDPTTVGAGDPSAVRSIAATMGLGGYFVVTEVKNAIEAGKFQTDLKCVWMATGSGKADTSECAEKEGCQEGAGGASPPGATSTPDSVSAKPGA